MKEIAAIILLPVAAGLLLLLIPQKQQTIKGIFALLVSAVTAYLAIIIFINKTDASTFDGLISSSGTLSAIAGKAINDIGRYSIFRSDSLSRLIMLFTAGLSFLIILYSQVYIKGLRVKNYYSYVLITAGCSAGAIFSDNLILFIAFWGILGISLYKLIPGSTENSSAAAKKTLILIGASDSIMLIGIALIWKMTGSLNISELNLTTDNPLSITAFLALAAGSFTKAGAFPFHSWVPDYSENAPASSSALLPASLDKLLGIYFLSRLTYGIFILNKWLVFIILLTGVITIISAVMMALVQHNYKRLLGFHAVSQVGYMILGLGMGSPLAIAAGLFHMLNNSLYKTGLFLSAGAVEYRTGKSLIEDLGGLSKQMPVTFVSALIFAVSISGVPPFNGFASKWMIYQGIIDFGAGADFPNRLWVLWLGMAVLGSALTLASFIKFIGGIFLGRRNNETKVLREVPFLMQLPVIILALVCLIFGVFATGLIVPGLFTEVTGNFSFSGFWNSSLVSLLVLVSIIAGVLIYLLSGLKKFRTDDSFIGGEKDQDETRYPTPEFYKTIGEIGFFAWMFRKAEEKWFDIYDLSKQMVLRCSHLLSSAHTGVLTGYILWVCAGLILMLLIMI